MRTIKDLYKVAKAAEAPLLANTSVTTAFPYMGEYVNDYANFDRYFMRQWGYMVPLAEDDDEDETDITLWSDFKADILSLLQKNNEKYTRLANIYNIEYNPLHNYDMTESSNDKMAHDAVDTTHDIGAQSRSTTYGAETLTDSMGNRSETSTSKAYTDEHTMGAEQATTENGIAGDNSASYADSTRSQTDTIAHTNKDEFGDHETDNTAAAYTDTHTNAEHVDTDSTQAYQNKMLVAARNDETDHTASRSGNIGVTTSQQLLESEIKLWKNFNFWEIVFKDILVDLCTYHDAGYDVTLSPVENLF